MKYEIACTLCGHNQIYSPRNSKTPKKPHTTCKSCGKDFSIDLGLSETIPRIPKNTKPTLLKKKAKDHLNPPEISDFIDDPDELLMSVSTRELNKKNPDPRWASILISVRKENIGKSKREGNIRSKFKSMDIKDIAKISSGRPIDSSQKPDFKESS